MNLLFVSGYDSMNYTLAECAAEARRRGHGALVVVRDAADRENYGMFTRRGIPTVSVGDFDCRSLDRIDIVVTSPVKPYYYRALFDEIHARGLFVIAFAALFSSVVMREYPDLVLCLGEAKKEEFDRYALKYSCISVGNPQYDALPDHRRSRKEDPDRIRRVLIVDQGGYPYGRKGKEQLAQTLKAIARNDPGRIYEIKRRYSGKKVSSRTHAVSESLADFMTDLPENLRFLGTDQELEELLGVYDAMITTWSTAFVDALVMDLPLVLISGLDSEDRFDVRAQRIDEAYEDLRQTGCVRDYRDLQQGRISFSRADEAYRQHMLYGAESKSAPRVLDLMELLCEKVTDRGLRFGEVFQTDYETFMNHPGMAAMVRADDARYLRKRKYLIRFNDKMQEWVYLNRCMGNVLNLDALKGYYEPEADEDFDRKLKRAGKKYQKARDVFFKSADGKRLVSSDRILQDFYFDWLYERGHGDELQEPGVPILAPESRFYNLCMQELDRGHTKEGFRYLDAFLNMIYAGAGRDLLKYQRFQQCMLRVFRKAGIVRFALFVMKGHHVKMVAYFDRAMVTDYMLITVLLIFTLARDGRFKECIEVYRSYLEKKKRPGSEKADHAGAGRESGRLSSAGGPVLRKQGSIGAYVTGRNEW